MRFGWIGTALVGLALLAAGVSAKEAPQIAPVQPPAGASLPAIPGGAPSTIATDGQGQCYSLQHNTATDRDYWLPAGDLKTVVACFGNDDCYDGRAEFGAPDCYKWALSEEAPALAWPPALTALPPGQCYSREDGAEGWSLVDGLPYRKCRLYDSCNGGLGNPVSLNCYKWATAADALGAQYRTTSSPAPSTVLDRGAAQFPACYWRSETTQRWEPMEIYSEVKCFRMDSCSGGSAQSGGGCYKWSEGRDAEALPWNGLKLATSKPSPLVDGLFELLGACPGEGCGLGDWRAFGAVQLLADSIVGAPVVATVPDGEWVRVVQSIDRNMPLHGVAQRDSDYLYAGDEIWEVGYEGEGAVIAWRDGDFVSVSDNDETLMRWDEIPDQAAPNPRAGWWVQVRRDNGQTGWVRDGGGFGCIGAIDPPPECTKTPAPTQ